MIAFLRFKLFRSLFALLLLGGGASALPVRAQAPPGVPAGPDALASVKAALRDGSAKDIAALFGPTVDLGVDGNKQTYSQTQAEFVVRDFFAKNPPVSFEFVHQGASDANTPYAIGRYTTKAGAYRVLVKLKGPKTAMVIDNLDFTKE